MTPLSKNYIVQMQFLFLALRRSCIPLSVLWNMLAVTADVSVVLYSKETQVICHTFPYGTQHNDGLGNMVANIHTV
jgi:hypothetical protein